MIFWSALVVRSGLGGASCSADRDGAEEDIDIGTFVTFVAVEITTSFDWWLLFLFLLLLLLLSSS